MKAPFPYFGGKSSVSDIVWRAIGDCSHYIEPFFGSGAVLLNRPGYHKNTVETICDKDGFVSNVWRALQADPDAVAKFADWPVNHIDLSARKRWLVDRKEEIVEKLIANPQWHDPKAAGWWIWAASCWIGSGMTSFGQIPHVGSGGMGVHALGQIPNVSDGGKGVHALGQIPHVSDGGMGVQDPYNTNLYDWFRKLSQRLRYVRVVCGDWTRVCGGDWQDKLGTCGIFMDPPYGVNDRRDVYDEDGRHIAKDVLAWARERGQKESYRIVLAGYEEYMELADEGWKTHNWKARGGYGNIARKEDSQELGKNNSHRETLYFSPHCLKIDQQQKLFDVIA